MRKVKVDLGEKSYHIVIGSGLGEELQRFIAAADFSRKALLVTDSNVGPLYGQQIKSLLQEAGLCVELAEIPAGERSKCLAVAESLYTKAIELGLDRRSPIFALGGGVVGDLTGFVAATYMRGVPFIQLPTSLLAQVDSSVGGKVAVNHALGKNLIGSFYQPKAVFMDLSLMRTLPKREIATGMGEIIKYGVIYDPDFFSFLEQNRQAVLNLEPDAATHMIARSCEIKADEYVRDGEEITVAGISCQLLATPGHTKGSCCYYFEKDKLLISGDTLFQESVGRTDLPTGSMSSLVRSVREKLMILPEDVKVYPGHGESTTIGHEKELNPFL